MMRSYSWLALALGSGMSAQALAQAQPVALTPSSGWHVNYADDSCRLLRTFGANGDQSVLAIDQFEPGDAFQLLVASKLMVRARVADARPRQVRLRFGPGEAEQELAMRQVEFQDMPAIMTSWAMLGTLPDEEAASAEHAAAKARGDRKAMHLADVLAPIKPMTSEREAAISFLSITGVARKPLVLTTGPMAKPMAALRACTDDLLRHWGVDPTTHKSLSRRVTPKGIPSKWVTSNDYPTQLLASGTQGLIQFRLSIDETGKVSDCHIQQSSRPAEFDRAVCKIMSTRGRFDPALDAEGRPVKSYWRSSFAFLMGG